MRSTPALLAMASGIALVACGGDEATGPEIPTPVVSSITPMEGTVGTEIRIDGTGFTSEVTVRFDDLRSPRVMHQAGALFALAPEGLTAGRSYRVNVLNDGKEPDTANIAFMAVPPRITLVNGVTRPRGLEGMTVIVEGSAFGDSLGLGQASVFFQGADGSPLAATVADTTRDWTNGFVVTQVPQGIADTSRIWVETPTGVSDSIEFRILQSGVFSPSLINWTVTSALPRPLQGLDAAFVPIEDGPTPANYVYALGGADSDGAPTSVVYRATVEQSGALGGAWLPMPDLPEARTHHAAVAATPFTAALDTTTTAAYLYVIGGSDSSGEVQSTVFFAHVGLDGSVGTWQSAIPAPIALHSAGVVVFRGYLYLAAGASTANAPQNTMYRAKVNVDGTLDAWESLPTLPESVAYSSLVNFGPFLYSIGGETSASPPVNATRTGFETDGVYFARIDLRTGLLESEGWVSTEFMGKARSKHSAVFAGGALFVTSGIYSGNPGSSENTFASLNSDGTTRPWQGATGSETIDVELAISLYNQALVTFIDRDGFGHLLVLGGADRENAGQASSAVVYY